MKKHSSILAYMVALASIFMPSCEKEALKPAGSISQTPATLAAAAVKTVETGFDLPANEAVPAFANPVKPISGKSPVEAASPE